MMEAMEFGIGNAENQSKGRKTENGGWRDRRRAAGAFGKH
jgi:hypothetical protein